jgi:hypothetical protein
LNGTVLLNNPPSRDWEARILVARGNLDGAIAVYGRLNTPSQERPFNALFEPLYVLETARLLVQKGDRKGAAAQYERFLALWQNADAGLPEPDEARRYLAAISG